MRHTPNPDQALDEIRAQIAPRVRAWRRAQAARHRSAPWTRRDLIAAIVGTLVGWGAWWLLVLGLTALERMPR